MVQQLIFPGFLSRQKSPAAAGSPQQLGVCSNPVGLCAGDVCVSGAAWFRPHILYAFLRHSTIKEAKVLLRVRDRFEACRLAGLGRTDWIKHLTKSQLFAVLAQALLGAAVGEVTIARMPVKTGKEGQGIEEVQISTMSHDDRSDEGGSANHGEEDGEEVCWPPRLDKHVRWSGSGRKGDDTSSVGTYDASLNDSDASATRNTSDGSGSTSMAHLLRHAASGSSEFSAHLRQHSDVAMHLQHIEDEECTIGTSDAHPTPPTLPLAGRGGAPAGVDGVPAADTALVMDAGDETQVREATDSVPELRRSASVASGRATSDVGAYSTSPLLDQGGLGVDPPLNPIPTSLPTLVPGPGTRTPSLSRSASSRRPSLPRGKLPIW